MQLYFRVLMRKSSAFAKQYIWHSICQTLYGHWATQRSDCWNASRDRGMLNCEPSFLICKLGYCYAFICRKVTQGNPRLLLEICNRHRGQICILLPTCHLVDVFIFMDITVECGRKGIGKWNRPATQQQKKRALTCAMVTMIFPRHAPRSIFVGPGISFI